ncbi:hypothetical protein FF011L_16580 [Roseimaritima multifibrata]|uniref:HEAT repeat protein n=1 Tax=Roseimaritima multifibrata TaxID=1930274 RepID=A0A517MDD7_9BACT|nr:hypothetical protein FF011L_16580 [Roseimaritima multifibrata]
MLRSVFSILLLVSTLSIMGCGGDPEPTATEPQSPSQMAKTDDQKIEYLIEMLHRKNSLKKNAQAARSLGNMGAAAESAIPELQKAIKTTKDDKVRTDSEAAIKAIQAAAKPAP